MLQKSRAWYLGPLALTLTFAVACSDGTPTAPTVTPTVAPAPAPAPTTEAPTPAPAPAAPQLLSLTIDPSFARGGELMTGVVALDGEAAAGGAAVTITSSGVDARPSDVVIAAGNANTTFPIPTAGVSSPTEVLITASYGGQSESVQIRLLPNVHDGDDGGGGSTPPFTQTPEQGPSASFTLGPNLSAFALLGGSAITCTTSTVTGDVGVSPGTAITGFPGSGCTVAGTIRTTADSSVAKGELLSLYGSLGQACLPISGNLNGVTLLPGTYCVAAAATNLSSTLTLSGNGVHLLRFASTFITSAGSQVILANGATCAGVAYRVGSSATLEGTLRGNIVALTAITMNPGAVITGRALARNAAVTLTTSVISNAGC
jgi:hypothetical protein